MIQKSKLSYSFYLIPILLLSLAGCGKNETAGGIFGTAAGALVGTAVAGRHDKATGAVIGGLVGNLVGREMGKPADREEEKERKIIQQRQISRHQAIQQEKISELESENQLLKKSYDRWCIDCTRKVTILGAQSCPKCGGRLIRHKYCRECGSKFSIDSGYKFCPYCDKVRLCGR